jgi:hypothetical protein
MPTQPMPPMRATNPQQPQPKPPTAKVEAHAKVEFTPKPAIDPRAEKPPAGAYADGMTIADEQRARSAWIEQHGDAAYREAVEERPAEERVNQQVPGVVPPTKRE